MKKFKKRNLKNTILNSITLLAVISFFSFGCGVDSGSIVPYIMVTISLLWLLLFNIVNYGRL